MQRGRDIPQQYLKRLNGDERHPGEDKSECGWANEPYKMPRFAAVGGTSCMSFKDAPHLHLTMRRGRLNLSLIIALNTFGFVTHLGQPGNRIV